MDYYTLLDLATDLGYHLAMCGAETFRIEESAKRVLASYGIDAEAFAIPNCLTVSIIAQNGKPLTRMRRIPSHGNDLDGVERYSNLSRRICAEHPEPAVAAEWLSEAERVHVSYSPAMQLAGSALGALGFAVLFGGSLTDSLCAAVCGLVTGLVNLVMDRFHVNVFFRTIIAAFLLALPAYGMDAAGLADNVDAVIIGALMILVPGLLFTNAMRDIIFGDTNSGINRIVQVFLIAAAIALGVGAAFHLASAFWGTPAAGVDANAALLLSAAACFVGCVGFTILFNLHGFGSLFCVLGGMFTWVIYLICLHLGTDDITACFAGTLFAALYSEVMARIRHFPAISYLVVSIFPLLPGAALYYTMNYVVRGDMEGFASQGVHTVAIAGVMAVAILFVSTAARTLSFKRK
ncbi:MAG: threonine/serine exporter family protein [Lachnospiraceae bacterium]|nr:threonine/serine exporter family protein [Lachnospiraceae bacterium]